jgi:hypothetical protein
MVAIGVLTAIAAASLQRSTVDNTTAGRWSKRTQASETAEGGLQRIAQEMLRTYNSYGNFNSMLGTIQFGTSSGGQYSVLVSDNSNVGGVDQDGNGNTATDADRIFRLQATGQVGPSEQLVEAFYKVNTTTTSVTWPPSPTGCSTPPCDSAALLCGDSNVSVGGSGQIDGADYPYPAYGCTGSSCNVSPSSSTTGNYDVIGDSSVSVSGSDVTSLTNQGASAGCTNWQTFYDTWSNVSSSAPGVVRITGSTYNVSNDCSSPKIFVIDTTSTNLSLASNTYMCGTFIFKSATSISITGTATMVGAILLMGNYPSNAFNPAIGTANVLGKIILRSTASDSGVEIGNSGSSKIYYSSSGMNAALQAVNNANTASSGGSLQLISWRTTDK